MNFYSCSPNFVWLWLCNPASRLSYTNKFWFDLYFDLKTKNRQLNTSHKGRRYRKLMFVNWSLIMSPVPHSSIRTRILYKMCLSAVRVFNKQHMDCEVQLTYSRQLLFFWGRGGQVSRSDWYLVFGMRSGFVSRFVICKTLQVCVQRLRFVPAYLTPRRASTHTETVWVLTSLYEKLCQLS